MFSWRHCWIIQVIFIMKDHWVHEVYRITHDIALYHLTAAIFITRSPRTSFSALVVMMMIEHFIHGLVVMLLCPTSLVYNDSFLFHLWHLLLIRIVNWVILLGVAATCLSFPRRRSFIAIYLKKNNWRLAAPSLGGLRWLCTTTYPTPYSTKSAVADTFHSTSSRTFDLINNFSYLIL